jgi:uncharacterized membrane protein YhhN
MQTFAIILYIAAAITFLTTVRLRPYPFSHIVKVVPIIILLIIALLWTDGIARIFVIAALLFSGGGDIALELQRRDRPGMFVVGLALFLIAHVMYIGAFALSGLVNQLDALPIILVLAILVYAGVLTFYLWPRLGKMRIPVILYIVAIFSMVMMSAFHSPLSWLIIVGAWLFAISDSLIAIHKFGRPIPGRDYWVMGTYYLAQLLIVLGFVVEAGNLGL